MTLNVSVSFQNMLMWPSSAEFQPCEQGDHSLSDFCFHRLIFFGGYGYAAQGPHRGTFEYDESSSLGVCKQKFSSRDEQMTSKSFNLCIFQNV